jgi:hypothetical protein
VAVVAGASCAESRTTRFVRIAHDRALMVPFELQLSSPSLVIIQRTTALASDDDEHDVSFGIRSLTLTPPAAQPPPQAITHISKLLRCILAAVSASECSAPVPPPPRRLDVLARLGCESERESTALRCERCPVPPLQLIAVGMRMSCERGDAAGAVAVH